jgi:hypothetical protein
MGDVHENPNTGNKTTARSFMATELYNIEASAKTIKF